MWRQVHYFGETLPVVLVIKILKEEYMDIAQLLKDNMEVKKHMQESEIGLVS